MYEELLTVFIFQYGLLAIFIGSLFEGELTLIFGGIAAYLGYLDFFGVILVSVVATLIGDHIFYYLGRKNTGRLGRRFPRLKRRFGDRLSQLCRHDTIFLFCSRFMFGMRTITPFAVGMNQTRLGHFSVVVSSSALVWSIAIVSIGYLLGTAAQQIMATVHYYQLLLFLLFLVPVAGFFLVKRYVSRKKVY